MIFIEFAGLPGSGKTTVRDIVINTFRDKGVDILDEKALAKFRSEKRRDSLIIYYIQEIYSVILYVLKNFRLLMIVLLFTFHIHPIRNDRLNRLYVLIKTLYKYDYSYKFSKDLGYQAILFDQGILQNIWSLMINGRSNSTHKLLVYLKNNTKHLPYIIFFRTNPELALKRIENRNSMQGRFDRMDPEKRDILINDNVAVFNLLLESLRRINGLSGVAFVSGDDKIDVVVSSVIKYIEDCFSKISEKL